jgi:hypothetical protein
VLDVLQGNNQRLTGSLRDSKLSGISATSEVVSLSRWLVMRHMLRALELTILRLAQRMVKLVADPLVHTFTSYNMTSHFSKGATRMDMGIA